jgi:hypothetical protein
MCVIIIIFNLNIVFIKKNYENQNFRRQKVLPLSSFHEKLSLEGLLYPYAFFLYCVNFELNFIEVFNPLTLYVNNCLCDLFLFVQKVNKIIVCEVHVNAIVIINVLFFMF